MVSKAQQACVNRYVKTKYDRINVTLPKGRREEIKAHAFSRAESTNAFIVRAINETLEHDRNMDIAEEIARVHGVTAKDILHDEQFAQVLDRYPDIKAYVFGQHKADEEPGD